MSATVRMWRELLRSAAHWVGPIGSLGVPLKEACAR